MSLSEDYAIKVRNLSKMYRVYSKPKDMLWELITQRPMHKEFWALRNITFDIKRGEVVGVVGRNGAGKSTLLRILAGTLDKTNGDMQINGKISAILELGTGFNGEYTGRENIYWGGLYLGMSRSEIDRKIESIIDFSELGSFIDQPFKTYSSGMMARLTFAVAISVDPDIFIIDEALSAGDALFAEKCYRRIRDIADSGATVFFCTHAVSTIIELCQSAILLSKSELLLKNTPREVVYAYDHLLADERSLAVKATYRPVLTVQRKTEIIGQDVNTGASEQKDIFVTDGQHEILGKVETPLPSNHDQNDPRPEMKAELLGFELLNQLGELVENAYFGENYIIRSKIYCHEDIPRMGASFRIETPTGITVYGLPTMLLGKSIEGHAGKTIIVEYELPCFLQQGTYILGGGIAELFGESNFSIMHILRGVYTFNVIGNTKFSGIADLHGKIKDIYYL